MQSGWNGTAWSTAFTSASEHKFGKVGNKLSALRKTSFFWAASLILFMTQVPLKFDMVQDGADRKNEPERPGWWKSGLKVLPSWSHDVCDGFEGNQRISSLSRVRLSQSGIYQHFHVASRPWSSLDELLQFWWEANHLAWWCRPLIGQAPFCLFLRSDSQLGRPSSSSSDFSIAAFELIHLHSLRSLILGYSIDFRLASQIPSIPNTRQVFLVLITIFPSSPLHLNSASLSRCRVNDRF